MNRSLSHETQGSASRGGRVGDALAFSLMAACCVLTVGVVWKRAWVSDDAFITFRYVDNLLRGHGAVFNVGERVQGYTHPLWFLLLALGCFAFRDPIYVSVAYGLVLTLLSLAVWARMLVRVSGNPAGAAVVFALSCLVCVSSDAWVSFQTGGLENALSHFLIVLVVAECAVQGAARPGRLTLYLALLCLSRPDFAFFCAPLGILLLGRVRSLRSAGAVVLAALPVLAWLIFSAFYYHDLVPNTARAKVGIYSTQRLALAKGLYYALDWAGHESAAALAAPVFLVCAVSMLRTPAVAACAAGAALNALYVVWIGGDFMRGRFFLAPFVAAMALGSAGLASQWRREGTRPLLATALVASYVAAVFVSALIVFHGVPETRDPRKSIVNERTFYWDYSLRYYRTFRRMPYPRSDPALAADLKAYADAVGPIAIHNSDPMLIAYQAGPKVSFIDMFGLTDRFIAELPLQHLVEAVPRAGHPRKYVPIAYLASRGDVALVPEWRSAIRRKDPSLLSRVREHENSPAFLDDKGRVFSRRVVENP